MRDLNLIGCASGVAGADEHSGDGPLAIEKSTYLNAFKGKGINPVWHAMFRVSQVNNMRIDEAISDVCVELANLTKQFANQNKFFTVIGGDHSCAIGTWSGVQDAYQDKGDIGLIWIDAHMDSHTPETSPSGRIHGMPLACLLGYGYPTLTGVLNYHPKIKPENLCLIGVRSFEQGEAELLKRLNVKIYFMDEIQRRGLDVVIDEAFQLVTKHTVGFGLTLDVDSIDPNDAPGVDVPEEDGISGDAILKAVEKIATSPKLIAAEIVEFDPTRDQDHKTEKLVVELIDIIAKHKV